MLLLTNESKAMQIKKQTLDHKKYFDFKLEKILCFEIISLKAIQLKDANCEACAYFKSMFTFRFWLVGLCPKKHDFPIANNGKSKNESVCTQDKC